MRRPVNTFNPFRLVAEEVPGHIEKLYRYRDELNKEVMEVSAEIKKYEALQKYITEAENAE